MSSKYKVLIIVSMTVESLYNPSAPISIETGKELVKQAMLYVHEDMITYGAMNNSEMCIGSHKISWSWDRDVVDESAETRNERVDYEKDYTDGDINIVTMAKRMCEQ